MHISHKKLPKTVNHCQKINTACVAKEVNDPESCISQTIYICIHCGIPTCNKCCTEEMDEETREWTLLEASTAQFVGQRQEGSSHYSSCYQMANQHHHFIFEFLCCSKIVTP